MRPRRSKAGGVRTPLAAAALMSLLAPAWSASAGSASPQALNLPAPGSYVLHRIQQAPRAPLLDMAGSRVTLPTFTRGAVTALAFFYSHCVDPEGCPALWSTFEAVREEAASDPALRTKLRLVFISLDPANDTPSVLRVLQNGEQNTAAVPWEFLTASSEAALAPLLKAMGQDIAVETDAAGKQTGEIHHMLKVFLFDPDGWAREIYTTAFLDPQSLLNDMRTLALAHPNASNRAESD